MSDTGNQQLLVDELRQEIVRLQNELAESSRERDQAAEYGLAVLQEKGELQAKLEETESLYDAATHELQCATENLTAAHRSHKEASRVGVTTEESLLIESATREASLLEQISDYEAELKHARAEMDRLRVDLERTQTSNQDLQPQVEALDAQRRQMKKEIKELKFRETRNMSDYSELEEENISLQKSVLHLKQAQVDFEAMKHTNKRLNEETEELHSELEELAGLKAIVEKNLDDTINSLQQEREQKHALKKELDTRLTNESLFNLHSLASSLTGDFGRLGAPQEDHDAGESAALRRAEAEVGPDQGGQGHHGPSDDGMVGDLFSELHMTEIRKLETLLEQTELDKQRVEVSLEESQASLEAARKEILEQKDNITSMKSHLGALAGLTGEPDSLETGEDGTPVVSLMHSKLIAQEQRYEKALEQIATLQEELTKAQTRINTLESGKDGHDDIRDETAKLRDKLMTEQESSKSLERDLKAMTSVAGETQASLNCTQDELIKATEELAQLYHLVCEVNGETPNRVMLEHVQGRRFLRKDSPKEENGSESSPSPGRDESPEKQINDEDSRGDPMTCYKLTATLHDQIRYLKRAVEHTIEASRQRQVDPGVATDTMELQEQVIKLKAMLNHKREQIATLRSVLKANKSTAEIALANLKGKYENEKCIVTETMIRLRNELKALKEDAATFASLRAMFAQRCDEYVTQLDELQRQLAAAEEEKKTLNSLLRMAIQQKLALTQRLEDVEFDRERRTMRGQQTRPPRHQHRPAGPVGPMHHPPPPHHPANTHKNSATGYMPPPPPSSYRSSQFNPA